MKKEIELAPSELLTDARRCLVLLRFECQRRFPEALGSNYLQRSLQDAEDALSEMTRRLDAFLETWIEGRLKP